MVLAQVIHLCEADMICDLAETYNIFDYRGLQPSLVATLVLGLRDDSRVKMRISNTRITLEQQLLAMIMDGINFICWTYSRDAKKGKIYNKKSILKALQGEYDHERDELEVFSSVEEFEKYMNSFIR